MVYWKTTGTQQERPHSRFSGDTFRYGVSHTALRYRRETGDRRYEQCARTFDKCILPVSTGMSMAFFFTFATAAAAGNPTVLQVRHASVSAARAIPRTPFPQEPDRPRCSNATCTPAPGPRAPGIPSPSGRGSAGPWRSVHDRRYPGKTGKQGQGIAFLGGLRIIHGRLRRNGSSGHSRRRRRPAPPIPRQAGRTAAAWRQSRVLA